MTHLSKIFIDNNGEPTSNPMPFPEKPRYRRPGGIIASYEDLLKAYDKAVEQWKAGCLKFESKEEAVLVIEAIGKKQLKDYDLINEFLTKLKTPNTFIDVDLEVEVIQVQIQCPDGIEGCEVYHYENRLRLVDKKQ